MDTDSVIDRFERIEGPNGFDNGKRVYDLEGIIKVIREKSCFLVVSHINPEGDAIGSALALTQGLRAMGKEVTVYFESKIPPLYRFMPLIDDIIHDIEGDTFEVAIIVDCGDMERVGEAMDYIRGNSSLVINIDHHSTNEAFGDLNIVDGDASATGVLIYRLLKELGVEITRDMAINLYVAILMDTGSFRYSSTTPEAFRIAADLMERGVNPWEMAKQVYESMPERRMRLLALVLEALEVRGNGKIAYSVVTRDMLRRTGATLDMTESFVNYPRSIDGVEVAMLIKEIGENEYKVSMRSKGDVDVAAIATAFGGGGHQRAAGFTITGNLSQVKERIVEAIKGKFAS